MRCSSLCFLLVIISLCLPAVSLGKTNGLLNKSSSKKDEKTLKNIEVPKFSTNTKAKTAESEAAIHIKKLGSTTTPTEQSFAKNKLIKMGDKALPYLEESLLTDKRTYTRIQIAFVIAKIKNESSIDALEKATNTQYSALNQSAVRAIGEIGGKKAIKTLKSLQNSTTNQMFLNVINEALEKATIKNNAKGE
ncbi:HEAT repeat domain-containing protein [Elusimicrobiota bacterium]